MKKFVSMILALVMLLSMTSFAAADQGSAVVVGLAGDPGNIGPFQGMGAGPSGPPFILTAGGEPGKMVQGGEPPLVGREK